VNHANDEVNPQKITNKNLGGQKTSKWMERRKIEPLEVYKIRKEG
jgi:hypothetical protein